MWRWSWADITFAIFPLTIAYVFGRYSPLGPRLVITSLLLLCEFHMVVEGSDGFRWVHVLNWLYVAGVVFGLRLRAWDGESPFWSLRHLDWLALAGASIVVELVWILVRA